MNGPNISVVSLGFPLLQFVAAGHSEVGTKGNQPIRVASDSANLEVSEFESFTDLPPELGLICS